MKLSTPELFELFKQQSRKHGPIKGLLRALRKDLQRLESRRLLNNYLKPHDLGLELGTGEQTIAPKHTKLTDAYKDHAGAQSLATEFFPAEKIPYEEQTFDFILAEHVLEHLPDPIKAIKEWYRVMNEGGHLFLFMPHPDRTFDRDRARSTLDQIKAANARNADSSDDSAWAEWEEKVLNPGLAPHYKGFSKEDSLKQNLIHRWVFTPQVLEELLATNRWEVLQVLDLVPDRTDSFAIVARRRRERSGIIEVLKLQQGES
jgi:SAM-dependent methyltransferase